MLTIGGTTRVAPPERCESLHQCLASRRTQDLAYPLRLDPRRERHNHSRRQPDLGLPRVVGRGSRRTRAPPPDCLKTLAW